jgi:hypothetical protein
MMSAAPGTMSVAPGTLEQIMSSPAVDSSLTTTAETLGLSKQMVTEIARVGVPLMARMASEDPVLFKALFAQSRQTMHRPVAPLSAKPAAQRTAVEEFKTLYGPMTEALHRETASQTGATEEQAGKVLAATLPAITHVLGQANTWNNEVGFNRHLKKLYGWRLNASQ